VEKKFRKHQIGTLLATKAVEYLEEDKPLITIPMDKLHEFTRIGEKYNWVITDIKENLYRTTTPEVIVNGKTPELSTGKTNEKSLTKVNRIYKIKKLKASIKDLLNYPQKLLK
jgi:predicted methyltransferase